MKNDIRLGIVLMVSATLFFAVMDGVSRYLAETYNVMVINMLRAWVLALIVILISMRKGKGVQKVAKSGNYYLQIIRGTILISCVCIGVYSFTILGLVTSHCIISCYPLVVITLSGPFLNEKIGWRSSRFKKISFPSLIDKLTACVVGELIETSYTDASSIILRYFFEFLKLPVFFIFNLNLNHM